MPDPGTEIALAAAKPLAIKLVDAVLKPVLSTVRLASDPLIDVFGDRFSEYLSRQLVKQSYLSTIVFQVRCPLEEVYVPLTITEESPSGAEKKSHKIDRYRKDLLPKLDRILVIDGAGMGKTTLSRFLFIQAIKAMATVPVFVELRHLNSRRTLLDHLLSEFNPIGIDESKFDTRQIVRLLKKGVFTFFLDGYDEISNQEREAVTRDIKEFTENHSGNKYLLTSRPEHALASFPSFKLFKIESLKKEEAFELIRKYDRNGERATKLIERLSSNSLREVDEFLKNPLLTTLLYRAYEYKNQIPLRKPVFYRQVYDALFEWHDLTKDGYSTR
jgi:predicted NACHT family NTPase